MNFFSSLLSLVHLVGLALGVGAATVKVVLLLKSGADPAFVPVYIKVSKSITRQIVLGLILMTLSGIGWLVLGYGFTPLLIVKVALVAAIWVIGPIIDNVVEPKFRSLAPEPEQTPSEAFIQVRRRYVTLEVVATMLFYVIVVLWVWRQGA